LRAPDVCLAGRELLPIQRFFHDHQTGRSRLC
jgi:hypothetical protein